MCGVLSIRTIVADVVERAAGAIAVEVVDVVEVAAAGVEVEEVVEVEVEVVDVEEVVVSLRVVVMMVMVRVVRVVRVGLGLAVVMPRCTGISYRFRQCICRWRRLCIRYNLLSSRSGNLEM
jgi:hypothetical protein